MEEWQKEHIQKNLVELIKNTVCNAQLIVKFKATEILSAADLEHVVRPPSTSYEKSKRLYEILLNKPSSTSRYDVLVQALEDTRQSKALRILKEHKILYRFMGCISYDHNHLLGTGTSGSKTYKGLFDGRDVAVKLINTDVIPPEDLLRELDFLKKLDNHQNILRYFYAENQENYVCIASELCVISLQDEMKLHLLNIDPITILKKCTKGLAHIHKHNIIHANMRPAHVLLSHDNQVKISDFALSKEIPDGMTSVNVHLSTEPTDWMAPEILQYLFEEEDEIRLLRLTTAADIFALGCIFYFVLTRGIHPFGNGAARQFNICDNNPQLQFCKVDHSWLHLFRCMISGTPLERPTCQDILAAKPFKLREAMAKTKPAPPTDTPADSEKASGSISPQPSTIPPKSSTSKDSKQETNSENATDETEEENTVTKEKLKNKPSNEKAGSLRSRIKSGAKNNKSNINDVDENGDNALFRAVMSGGKKMELSKIVKLGGDWKRENIHGHSILHVAAEYGNVEALRYFISLGADPHLRDNNQESVLHRVSYAKSNFSEIVGILLENNLEMNAVNKNGNNLVFLAALRGRSREELEMIVKTGGDWQRKTKNGHSVLHRAAEGGNVEGLKYFIGLGADVNARTKDGETPLHRVRFAKQNFMEAIDELLLNGADPNATTDAKETLYMMLLNSGGYNELSVLKNYGLKYDCSVQ